MVLWNETKEQKIKLHFGKQMGRGVSGAKDDINLSGKMIDFYAGCTMVSFNKYSNYQVFDVGQYSRDHSGKNYTEQSYSCSSSGE